MDYKIDYIIILYWIYNIKKSPLWIIKLIILQSFIGLYNIKKKKSFMDYKIDYIIVLYWTYNIKKKKKKVLYGL